MNYHLRTIKSIQIKPTQNVCISCSLFTMFDTQRYRRFEKYVNNFETWLRRLHKTFYVRLYVDASVLDNPHFERLFIRNYDNLEIILYEFPDFLAEDKIHHDGTFGTIVRFLPLYNDPPLPKSVEYIWVSDVDMPQHIFSYQNITDLKRKNAVISTYAFACYTKAWVPKDIEFPSGAGKIITSRKVRYPKKDFVEFLSNILNGKYVKIKEEIIENATTRKTEGVKYFPYGFDELFVNLYLEKIFNEYRRIIYYSISLERFRSYIPKALSDKVLELGTNTWRREATPKQKEELLKVNDEIYKIIKNIPLENNRLKICRAQFEKYHDRVMIRSAPSWNLTAFLIENPKCKK